MSWYKAMRISQCLSLKERVTIKAGQYQYLSDKLHTQDSITELTLALLTKQPRKDIKNHDRSVRITNTFASSQFLSTRPS